MTLATGVWSMHFVAMLAANFPSAIDYLVLPTLLSFLICVIVVGVGVYVAHAPGPPALRIGAGAIAMGLGISLMHYVGMSAVHLAGPTYQETPYVVASVIVSVGASGFALWVLDSRPTKAGISMGALALGLAISGMHYTAMAGMRLDPRCFDVASFVGADSALSRNTLALLTTLVAFGVSGAFLLSLVPDRGARALEAPPRIAAPAPRSPAQLAPNPRTFPPTRHSRPRRARLRSASRRTDAGGILRSRTFLPSAPTRITPTSTMGSRNISAICRSAPSRRGSTPRCSSASIAAISSLSGESPA